jgi:transglutaminase-like putative cysteine protease/tetratricopeptide (TPR) repeat protein
MYRFVFSVVFLSSLGCAASSAPPAQTPKNIALAASSPTETAQPAKGEKEQEPRDPMADVLLWETELSFDSAEKYRLRSHRVVKLLTPAGVRAWQTVEAAWAPWYQTRPTIEVTVTTPDGKKHGLDPSTMVESGVNNKSSTILSDRRVLRAPLPALTVGATIDITITDGAHRAFLGKGQYVALWLYAHRSVARRRVTLKAPAKLPLRLELRGAPFKPKKDEVQAGIRQVVYELGRNTKKYEVEALLPPSVPRSSYLAVSTTRSWRDISKTYSKIVDQRIKGAVDSALAQKALGGKSVRQLGRSKTIQTLVRWVRKNVRYTGVEFGRAAIVPYRPGEVLRRKFGDCKDQSSLLVALLRQVGISASVALLRAGTAEDTNASIPGAQQFNHAIVYIPGKKPLWIDPTSTHSRVGSLPIGVERRLALVANGKSTRLVRTHLSGVADNRYKETRVVHLPVAGKARVVETSESYGSIERRLRGNVASRSDKELNKNGRDYAKRLYLAKEVPVVRWTPADDYSKPFGYHIEVAKSRHGVTEDTDTSSVIDTDVLFNWLPHALTPKKDAKEVARKQALYLSNPYTAELHYRIVGPPGFTLRALPKGTTKNLGPARMTTSYKHDKKRNTVLVATRFSTEKRQYSASEVNAFRKAWRNFDYKTPTVSFQNEAFDALQKGKIKAAVTKARTLAERFPKDAAHRGRFALVLLKAGFGMEAQHEAKKAAKLAPRSVWVNRVWGWALQHDQIGRRFGRNFDRQGSLAAFRKAKELDPKDLTSRTELLIALEHDSSGRRYGPGANLKEAVAEYRQIRKELKNQAYDDDLMIALLRMEDYKGVRKLLKTLAPSFNRQIVEMTAIAALEGAEEAIAYAKRTKHGQEQLAKLVASTMLTLLQNRHYSHAVDLMQRFSPANGKRFATVFKNIKRYDGTQHKADTPENFSRRFMAQVLSGTLQRKDLARWMADPKSVDIAEFGKVKEMLAAGTRSPNWKRMGGSPEMLLDMVMSMPKFNVNGNARLGYRIRMKMPGAATKQSLILYAIKTRRGLRMVASGSQWGELGGAILNQLKAGRLAQARQWLDWSLEDAVKTAPGLRFGKFWRHGKRGDKKTIALAAAILNAQSKRRVHQKTIPTIKNELATRQKQNAPAKIRWVLENALAVALTTSKRYKELLTTIDAWDDGSPREVSRFLYRKVALEGLKRYAELKNLAKKRLEEYPNDKWATWARVDAVVNGSKDYKRGRQILRRRAKEGTASVADYNMAAWLALFSKPFDKEALEDARQANELAKGADTAVLDTLATVHAEGGDLGMARKYWLQGLEIRGANPESGDWYVYGRIAERAGLTEQAKAAYKKVKPGKKSATSQHALAQRRLKSLQ